MRTSILIQLASCCDYVASVTGYTKTANAHTPGCNSEHRTRPSSRRGGEFQNVREKFLRRLRFQQQTPALTSSSRATTRVEGRVCGQVRYSRVQLQASKSPDDTEIGQHRCLVPGHAFCCGAQSHKGPGTPPIADPPRS